MKALLIFSCFLSGALISTMAAPAAFAKEVVTLSGLNNANVSQFTDGSVTCYVVEKLQVVTGKDLTSSISCIGDSSKLTPANLFMEGAVTRVQDNGNYCYVYNSVVTAAISCIK